MRFDSMLERLRGLLRERVHNGELTERGFARQIGLSQSHVHNVLCGARVLTVTTADRILEGLGLTVLDLVPPDVLNRRQGAGPEKARVRLQPLGVRKPVRRAQSLDRSEAPARRSVSS